LTITSPSPEVLPAAASQYPVGMSAEDDAVESLLSVGLTRYEARAYLALITSGRPLSGYEVAKQSGIPRSTVYETLEKMTARGSVFEVRSDTDAVAYVPLPPASLMRRMREQFEGDLDQLNARLRLVKEPPPSHVTHHLEGRLAILARAGDLVASAGRGLLILAGPDELAELGQALREADGRGVDILIARAGSGADAAGRVVDIRVPEPEAMARRTGGRLLIVVQDEDATVVGGLGESRCSGVFTSNPANIVVAAELIRHSVALQRLGDHFGTEQVASLLAEDPALRLIFTGRAPAGTSIIFR
jgi:HTH-type transcriptional regulator, sugar sensing transcriptional regulator